jgi:hypothetical protein
MKVSMRIYGEQAQTLARELGLECSNKTADVQMTAHFTYKDVEGRTVVSAEFTSTETPEPADCSGNEEQEEAFHKTERCFDVSREARGY